MVSLLIVLLIIGLCLLFAEMFMPGFGVFGISGIAVLIVSAVMAVVYVPVYGIYIVMCQAVTVFGMLYFGLKYIKKNGLNGKLILTENLASEEMEEKDLESLYGKEGITTTVLRPYGTAVINGEILEVSAIEGYIPEKTRVIVIDASKEKIIVEKISEQRLQ